MAKKKKIDYDKYAAGLFARTEQYADKVRQHYATAVEELLKLTANGDLGSSGAFSFGDNTKLSEKANSILRGLYSAVYNEIKGGVASEWEYANLSCDALIESIFGKGLNEDNHFARWFSRNQQAMDSFFKRKSAYGGLNLSQNVWKYVGNLKTEMEVALTVSLGQGDSAATVSRKVRKYLQEPDMMFRRFRVKVGEEKIYDEETGELIGTKPIYGRKWKRKVIDPQTGAVTWENFNPRNYHPGQGVYRSSYKNAMRLTRTETNMAYRSAEQDRWERMDFVVGYRVKRSNNHPAHDICDDLSAANNDDTSTKGVYPKDFVFKGWHPQCRCFVVPILAEQDEFIEMQKAILNGEQPKRSKDMVRKPNDDFYEWWDKNKERVETATSMPYWVQDNQDYINKKKKIRVKTEEEREEIRKRWAERAIKNQKIIKMATNVANVAQNYPEIDLTKLQEYINAKNVSLADTEARTIAKQVSAIKQDEKALSALIPDVHTWKQQFTSAELHQVFDAVETKLNGWASLTLEQQEKKLKFEAYDFLGGNMKGVQQKYHTWKVSQSAYIKKLTEVQEAIEWQGIGDVLAEAKTFKTKSKPYLDLISQLETAISAKDKANAQSIVANMQAKRIALKKAAEARNNGKELKFTASDLSNKRKNAAVWHHKATDANDYFFDDIVKDFWKNCSDEEKEAFAGYTAGSAYITEPLRGIVNHLYYYTSKMKITEKHVEAMTKALQRVTLKDDVWIKRDAGLWDVEYVFGLRNKLGIDPSDESGVRSTLLGLARKARDDFKNSKDYIARQKAAKTAIELDKLEKEANEVFQKTLSDKLVGTEGIDRSFMSCGSCKETYFTCTGHKDVVYNIYAPKGTHGVYAQPWSSCGSFGPDWDCIEKPHVSASSENEVLLQRGTRMRITKVEYNEIEDKWYVDVEILGQSPEKIKGYSMGSGGYKADF